jgi:VWFA-related protein
MRRTKNPLWIGALALAGLLIPSAATTRSQQTPTPSQDSQPAGQGPTIRRQVNLVNVFATARDKNKRIVVDLKQEDFRLFEDNKEETVAFFSRETSLPITLGLLIDTSGSERNRLSAEQEAATRFLMRVMRKGDEAMVISFDLDVDLLADFTEDRARLEHAIRRARIGAAGAGGVVTPGPLPTSSAPNGTHFYDAIYLACMDKLVSEAGRKALVIITDAEDFGSRLRLEEAIEAAQRTDTVVHILLVRDPGQGSRPDIAKKIVDETGGRLIEVSSEKKLEQAFDQISEELRSQYLLGYYPSNTKHDGGYRKIKVEPANKDLKVLARRGYYAPKS